MWYHLYVENKNVELIKTESRIVVTSGGSWIGDMLFKGKKIGASYYISPGDLMHSIVI